jgi:hypothetical protein
MRQLLRRAWFFVHRGHDGICLPATRNARRRREARLRDHAGRAMALAQWLASPLLRGPVSRGVFAFVIASLLRSRATPSVSQS